MTILGRSIVRSTNYIGAPGYNIIHWSAGVGPGPTDSGGVEEFHDTLAQSFTDIVGFLVDDVVFTIEESVAYFDDSDGVLLGSTTDPSGDRVITGTGDPSGISRATQILMNLRTDDYVNGRRLQGRIFIGPISTSIIGTTGQLGLTVPGDVETAFSGLISGLGGRLAVWHRPTTSSGSDGSYGDVTSLTVRGTPGTLRSRKT